MPVFLEGGGVVMSYVLVRLQFNPCFAKFDVIIISPSTYIYCITKPIHS